MKRNWDTVRRILLVFENFEYCEDWCADAVAEEINEDAEVVLYHIRILLDAGFLMRNPEHLNWTKGMTMKGHDLLDQIREQTL
jgi:hypothetical protein